MAAIHCVVDVVANTAPTVAFVFPTVTTFHSSCCHPSLNSAADILFLTIFTIAASWLLLLTVASPTMCCSRCHCLLHWNTVLSRMMPLHCCFLSVLLALAAVTVCCTFLQCHQCWLLTFLPPCCLLMASAEVFTMLLPYWLSPPLVDYCFFIFIVSGSSAVTACSGVLPCAGAASTAASCHRLTTASCCRHHSSWVLLFYLFHHHLRQSMSSLAPLHCNVLAQPPLLCIATTSLCFLRWPSPQLIVALFFHHQLQQLLHVPILLFHVHMMREVDYLEDRQKEILFLSFFLHVVESCAWLLSCVEKQKAAHYCDLCTAMVNQFTWHDVLPCRPE